MSKDYDYKDINTERKSGIILHISSLPSKYGIGTFGKKAYEFCDFLKKSGIHYWQILPIGPTGYGDSPYQSFSSFAGNPYFIDLDILNQKKLLKKEEYANIDFGSDENRVDYGKLYENRYKVLKIAFSRFKATKKYNEFLEEQKDWIHDYALFMALKQYFNGKPWNEWDDDIKNREKKAILKYSKILSDQIDFQYFLQYEFYVQYNKLKKYVNSKNIQIIGDIPIYCSFDSADVWTDKKQFDLNLVGGCPPDGYSDDGQLWGNPTYNWKYMKKDKYSWWIRRVEKSYNLFDIIRIDHFRGFESYWAVETKYNSSKYGKWYKGPSNDLFDAIKNKIKDVKIIAEDLGYTTKEVVEFRKKTGFPGMKMLQFAFDPNKESDFLPHNIERNWSVYPSTHDSDTLYGWVKANENTAHFNFAKKYLNLTKSEGYANGILRAAWSSVANIAVTQLQDFIGLDNDYRMNVPSTLGNWTYRVNKKHLSKRVQNKIYMFNKIYSRLNK